MANLIVPYSWVGSFLGDEEVQAVSAVLSSGAPLSCAQCRQTFEVEFRRYVGVSYAYALTNCTAALELATWLIGLKPGDEVIATPQSYQATVEPLLLHSGPVHFCDIDPNSLNISPNRLEELITPRTRAIFLVHYGGLTADMDPIMELARQHRLVVVEDCAHAHGSEYRGRRAGALGHFGCFSFGSVKNMTTLGQGGMITFDDPSLAERVERLRGNEPDALFVERADIGFGNYPTPVRNLNRHDKNAYTHDCIELTSPGTNWTLAEPACAVGTVQLRKLDRMNARRQEIARRLDDAISQIPGLRVQEVPPDYKHVYHLYTFFVDPKSGLDREAFATAIEDAGVEIHLRYFPLYLLPEWRRRGHHYGECPVAERIWFEEQVNLPCYPSLTDDQVDFMIEAVAQAAKLTRRKMSLVHNQATSLGIVR